MSEDTYNYKKDMHIDETALDVEWLEQPNLMMKYGRLESELDYKLSTVKEELDLVKSDLDLDIRTNPEKYNVTVKITEAVVNNTIIKQDVYQKAYHAFLEVTKELSDAKVAVRAVSHRKDALENLVRLHGQQYFAGPKIPRDVTAERQTRTQTRQASNQRVQRIRRKS